MVKSSYGNAVSIKEQNLFFLRLYKNEFFFSSIEREGIPLFAS